ncbi:MAG: ABC transporter permease [Chloroflexota bacterium]|nr:ABC transporter permease [Chloroflexota bacterium]
MTRYLLRRVLQSILLLVVVSIIGFGVLNLAPGGPLAAYALNPAMTQADRDRLAHQMGLDQPLPLQYGRWASGFVVGDWGRSFRDSRPVLPSIAERVPATLELMLTSTLLAVSTGILVGLLGALRRYSVFDYLATIGAMVALSLPTFWFGLMAIFLFSVRLGWLPSGGIVTEGDGSVVDRLRHLVAPMLVLALVTLAIWSRYTRSALLDVLHQDFMRTARAKGVREWATLLRHGFPNAVLPLITLAGLQLPTLFGGALVTETVFTWPGMGRLFVDSLGYRDYPILMGTLMLTALIVLAGNLVADLLYATFDPRIRLT